MRLASRKGISSRNFLAALTLVLAGGGVLYLSATSLVAKPVTPLPGPVTTRVSVVPITFDPYNPKKTKFGKLTFRGGLNMFARSAARTARRLGPRGSVKSLLPRLRSRYESSRSP